jgi:glucan phosphoethanolaminetransferase (alkaline phosphatase superfamily)
MAKKKMTQQEFYIYKLGKYTNLLASLSALTLVIGIFVGSIMALTASGFMGSIICLMGIFIFASSILYYWVSQYFVYMGKGMLSILDKLLEQPAQQEIKPLE